MKFSGQKIEYWWEDLNETVLTPTAETLLAALAGIRARELDRAILAALATVGKAAWSTNVEPESGALTFADIGAVFDRLPPRETWVSWAWFEGEDAYRIAAQGENLVIAGPRWWARNALRTVRLEEASRPYSEHAAVGLREMWGWRGPLSIDPDPSDSAEKAAWRSGQRDRIVAQLLAAVRKALEQGEIRRPDPRRGGPWS
jgi:hypothetical protein